ncbi:MAG: hypothetical protein KI790_00985 [Cyclobacteriaceae bacterium]|nr:hypothetical protein [Cyclobacteriaceae bacterium HetDA_MAG_MS6]
MKDYNFIEMNNAPIRILVVLAMLSLFGIIATQVYWVNKAVRNQEQQFNHGVQMALRNVVELLCEANGTEATSNNPVELVSNNYFVVRTNNNINLESLEYFLQAEFEKKSIQLDFEYGVYDCSSDRMVYGDFFALKASQEKHGPLPSLEADEYYFGVYFPSKSAGIFGEMDLWKFTTGLTVVVIIFFGYALLVILKQRRLSVVQRDFINNITHELKTPLATLKVAAEVLKEHHEGKEERIARYASIVTAESGRLERQVEQLLKSALLDQKVEIEKQPVSVSGLLESLKVRFDYSLQKANKKLQVKPLAEEVQVLGDPFLLETALHNLVDNAIKYGGDRIIVEAFDDGKSVSIKVQDNGPGIPGKEQKKIFQRFYRLTKGDLHDTKGFGLGLHFVKKVAERFQGKVLIACGEDCTFTLKLKKYE